MSGEFLVLTCSQRRSVSKFGPSPMTARRALRNSLHRVTRLNSQSAKEQRLILLHEHGQVQLLWGQSHMTTNETLSPHNIFTGSTLTTTTAKTSSNTHEQTYENFQCLKVDLGINFVKVSHIICHPVA